jgi:hypothetical protein
MHCSNAQGRTTNYFQSELETSTSVATIVPGKTCMRAAARHVITTLEAFLLNLLSSLHLDVLLLIPSHVI